VVNLGIGTGLGLRLGSGTSIRVRVGVSKLGGELLHQRRLYLLLDQLSCSQF